MCNSSSTQSWAQESRAMVLKLSTLLEFFISLKQSDYFQTFSQHVLINMNMWHLTDTFPERLVLGPPLLDIFVRNMDSGLEHTFSRFADDAELCGAGQGFHPKGA